jgi:hypothetical protein
LWMFPHLVIEPAPPVHDERGGCDRPTDGVRDRQKSFSNMHGWSFLSLRGRPRRALSPAPR